MAFLCCASVAFAAAPTLISTIDSAGNFVLFDANSGDVVDWDVLRAKEGDCLPLNAGLVSLAYIQPSDATAAFIYQGGAPQQLWHVAFNRSGNVRTTSCMTVTVPPDSSIWGLMSSPKSADGWVAVVSQQPTRTGGGAQSLSVGILDANGHFLPNLYSNKTLFLSGGTFCVDQTSGEMALLTTYDCSQRPLSCPRGFPLFQQLLRLSPQGQVINRYELKLFSWDGLLARNFRCSFGADGRVHSIGFKTGSQLVLASHGLVAPLNPTIDVQLNITQRDWFPEAGAAIDVANNRVAIAYSTPDGEHRLVLFDATSGAALFVRPFPKATARFPVIGLSFIY